MLSDSLQVVIPLWKGISAIKNGNFRAYIPFFFPINLDIATHGYAIFTKKNKLIKASFHI